MQKTIKTTIPRDLLKRYKSQIGIKGKDFGISQIRKMFLIAVEDFKNKNISVEEFSSICHFLFGKIVKNDLLLKDKNLFGAILAGSELDYYRTQSKNTKQYKDFLDEVFAYYKSKKIK